MSLPLLSSRSFYSSLVLACPPTIRRVSQIMVRSAAEASELEVAAEAEVVSNALTVLNISLEFQPCPWQKRTPDSSEETAHANQ
eukprot:4918290-Amphidinium_carterae.1